MSDPRVLGLDLSMTCTGRCRHTGETDHFAIRRSRPAGMPPFEWRRKRAIWIRDWCADDITGASLMCTEDIGSHQGSSIIALTTIHTVIDQRARHTIQFKVSAQHLKQYATGHGGADKKLVFDAALTAGWSGPSRCDCCRNADEREASGQDEGDSFWLYAIAMHLEGDPVVDVTDQRDDVIHKIRQARTGKVLNPRRARTTTRSTR